MKNILLILGIGILPLLADAQTEKGQGIWTGSMSFGYSSQKSESSPNYSLFHTTQSLLSFSRGVFLKDNWLAGGELSVGLRTMKYSVSTPEANYKFTNLNPSLSGFVRRYWGKEKWRLFLGGGISTTYGWNNYKGQNVATPDANSFTINPFFQAGANYFLTDRIGIEASAMSYSSPLYFSGFSVGLFILTGKNTVTPIEQSYEAPQTAKGRKIIGGSFEFSTKGETLNRPDAEEVRSNSFAVSPSVGWFIKKNLLLGMSVPLSINWQKEGSNFSYGINPYLKKYMTDNRLRPYIEGSLSYYAIHSKSNGVKATPQQNAGFSANAGLAYLLGDRFIIEARLGSLNFTKHFLPKNTGYSIWSTGLTASLQPGFSINYVFD